MKINQLFWIVILCIVLASCASKIAKVPQDWPKAVKGDDNNTCINLSGLYINKSIEAPDNYERKFHEKNQKWAAYLSGFLIPYIPTRGFVEHQWADIVELKGVIDNQLEVIMWKNDKQIYRNVLNDKKDFTCSARNLIIKSHYSPDNMMGISERFTTIELSRGYDGSILAELHESELGTVILIPYWDKKVQRYLFLPVVSE